LLYIRTFEQKKNSIEVEKFDEYKKLLKMVADSDNSKFVFRKNK